MNLSISPEQELGVEPNPAKEGGDVTVTGEPGATVWVSWGSGSKSITLDKNGKHKLSVPVEGGQQFTVGDCKWPDPQEVTVDVNSGD